MKNLFIITGGYSVERNISIYSANNFIKYIDKNKFKIFFINFSIEKIFFIDNKTCHFFRKNDLFYCVTGDQKINVDYVLPIIHGEGLEDGYLQGYFFSLGFNHLIANNVMSSSISFDKIFAKNISKINDIEIIPYIDYSNQPCSFSSACDILKNHILFLKPSNSGSSFGCYKVTNNDEFENAIKNIKKISDYPLIESHINAYECSCSVLYGEASDVIMLDNIPEFFSYESKYLNNQFHIKLLNESLSKKIKNYSLKLFHKMRFNVLCRFDYFICKKTGLIYFNEANSLPGLGENSLFFHSFASKYSKKELVAKFLNGWIDNKYDN